MPNKPAKAYHLTGYDVDDALSACIRTKHVIENPAYAGPADAIFPFTIGSDFMLNAFSCVIDDRERESLKQNNPSVDWDRYKFGIVVFDGILIWMSLLGYVTDCLVRTEDIGRARKMLRWMGENLTDDGDVPSDMAERFMKKFWTDCGGDTVERTRTYSMSILYSLMGHEMGHICLGHVMSMTYCDTNSLSRNDERAADLFAASIAQSMNSGYIGAICTTILDISFTWAKKNARIVRYGSHPDPTERVRNFTESFAAVLDSSRIDSKALLKLCR